MQVFGETEAAYLAGLIDGEGCFTASVSGKAVNAALELTGCDRALIDSLVATTGLGSVSTRPSKGNARASHRWKVSLVALRPLLGRIKPYLRSKLKQCEIFELLANRPSPTRFETTEQLSLVARLRSANARSGLRYERSEGCLAVLVLVWVLSWL